MAGYTKKGPAKKAKSKKKPTRDSIVLGTANGKPKAPPVIERKRIDRPGRSVLPRPYEVG